MNKIRLKKLMAALLADAASALSGTLLETCADQEYRLCLIELGIN